MNARAFYLLAALAGAVGLWLYSRTRRGQELAVDALEEVAVNVRAVAETVAAWVSRGLRNNNPGNIRHGASAWQGMTPTQTDKAFVQFTDMRYGVRAAAVLFRNYQRNYALHSVRQLITRWAPPSENNTAAYIAAVASRLNVNADSALDLSDTVLLEQFLRAVFRHENGLEADLLSDQVIREGVRLA